MQIIAKRSLIQFWKLHPKAKIPLSVWHATVKATEWAGPVDVRDQFGNSVDFVADNRIVFDIGGNKYRLIVHVAYQYKRVLIKFVGTHAKYDQIDAATVSRY